MWTLTYFGFRLEIGSSNRYDFSLAKRTSKVKVIDSVILFASNVDEVCASAMDTRDKRIFRHSEPF